MNQTNTFTCTPASPCNQPGCQTCRNTVNTLPKTMMEAIRQLHPNASGYVQFRFINKRTGKIQVKPWPIDHEEKDTEIQAVIEALNDAGFDAYVNTQTSASPTDTALTNASVDQLSLLFIDFDLATHEKPNRPISKAEALSFLRDELSIAPTMVLDSGGGLQALFALESPMRIADEKSRLRAKTFARAFQQFVHAEAQSKRGWSGFDNVADLARLHRVPFTMNLKPDVHAPCVPIWASYLTQDFEALEPLVLSHERKSSSPEQQNRTVLQTETLLREAGTEWFRAQQANRKSPQPISANPEAIALGCPFIKYTIDNAERLTNAEWHAQLSILARTVDGAKLCHELSSVHVGYDHSETEKKIQEVLAAPGPYSIHAIEESTGFRGYVSSPFYGRLSSPIDLGSRPTDQVQLLLDYAYVAKTDEFVNLRRCEVEGIKAETFKRLHAHLKLLAAPDKSILDDPLCQKADERTYMPGRRFGIIEQADGKRLLNIYRAPQHDADPACADIFFEHLKFLVPDEAERTIFIKWLAHLVQRPWEKLTYSVALIGGQGTGKSYLLDVMKSVLGESNVHIARGGSLVNQFDGHLAGKVLLGLEELSINERMEVYERLKTLITNETDQFQRKNVNFETLQTPRGVLVLSNDTYALTLPDDDRRFFVIQTASAPHPEGTQYYDRLFDITPGLASGIHKALSAVELSDFDAKRPPFVTSAKAKMIEYSRPEIDVLVSTLIEDGNAPFDREFAPWTSVKEAIIAHSYEKLTDKRIKRALAAAGAHCDARQVRLKSGRVRMVFFCDPTPYANYSPTELAQKYERPVVTRRDGFEQMGGTTSQSAH